MASKAPFVFVFSGIHHRRGTCKRRDFGRESDIGTQKRSRSTGKNILAPNVGHDTKHCPISKNQEDPRDEKYEAGTSCTKRG